MKRIFFVALLWMLLMFDTAHAYLDAGSQSVVLQMLVSALAGIALFVKLCWNRILQVLGLRQKNKKKETH